ncbi:Rv3654c family TadE-like protein [Blastococcus xanthinilyticus]|uniref:Secretion/DNA translocation related TadE-like protein n=1 Tax=Blastococcus xanthinilyticus TaxID=1564164 RepID=A0A5S5CT52_9ACTN|nr:Rv3654c family TadE-like protein [Blastococcus xanthinilyticus]TYP84770.1 secretion/DNA translocation related TadE-like protein [Blastococcus xanthinilyticus]
MSGERDERGSATVWVLALSAVLALVAAAGVLAGAAAVARHRAAGAADLAALAAAGRAVLGDPAACAVAAETATANGAELTGCAVGEGSVVDVTVEVPVRLGRLGVHTAHGRARAGPAPAPGA